MMYGFIRLALVILIAGAFLVFMLRILAMGIKTGKMPHTDSRKVADRQKQPLFFWFLFVLFSVFAAGACAAILKTVWDVLS